MNHQSRDRKRTRWLLLCAACVGAAGVFAACGSDDVVTPPTTGIDGGGDGESEATTTTDSATESDGGTDASTDALVVFDAPGDDAAVAERDAAKIEAGAPCPGINQCDCDNDGYQAKGDACAGNDCDDLDSLRHPNQSFVVEPPDPASDGNWDCVNPIDKQYTVNLNCATLLGLSCNATAQGFTNDPKCGEETDYYQCNKPSLLEPCAPKLIGKRRQGCK